MSYNLILTQDAQEEEQDAYNYYEDIRGGLGDELLIEFIKCYQLISDNPFYNSYVNNSKVLRDICVRRFPYLIIYMVSGNNVVVASVRNTHRKPYN
jgi:hypothetical protein